MLNGIASYLFGTGDDATQPPQDPQMLTTDADDDWVLVDVTNGQGGSSPRQIHPAARGQSSAVSVPGADGNHRGIEESWMVTPPPCFTAGGNAPHQLATSPMEDLLIEHPSMSVYHSQGHEPGMKAPSSGMVTRARARQHQQGKQVVKKTRNLRVRNTEPPRRAAAVAARAGIAQPPSVSAVEEAKTAKHLQHKFMSRSKMSRQNKAYHQNGRSGRNHFRQDLMGRARHSGAIYKQKC